MTIRQGELGAGLDPRESLLGVNPWPRQAALCQRAKPFGYLTSSVVEPGEEDAASVIDSSAMTVPS